MSSEDKHKQPSGPRLGPDGVYHGVAEFVNYWQHKGRNRRALVAVSGGMDSATLAYFALETFSEVVCVSFEHDGESRPHEVAALDKLESEIGVVRHVDLAGFEREQMLDVLAWVWGCDCVLLGTNSMPEGETHLPRERADGVEVFAPFHRMTKSAILVYGYMAGPFVRLVGRTTRSVPTERYGVPYQNTRTCTGGGLPCGRCGSCKKRIQAFDSLGLVDPLQYENRPSQSVYDERVQSETLPNGGGVMCYMKSIFNWRV